MMQDTTLRGRCRSGRRGAGPVARGLTLLLLLGLGACGGGAAQQGRSGVEAGPVATPADPIAAFAARAQPGSESRIVLSDGQPATVRLARSYHAASGRECREVLVGAGTAQRAQLVCQGEGGTWAAARPLLRGSGAARP
jgi:hypothetical protein